MSLAIRKTPLGLRLASARLAWIIAAFVLLLGSATAAYGFWAALTNSSNAAAAADTLSPGSKPAVTASANAVSVTWAGGTTVNGRAATGYLVTRYSTATGGTGTAATGGCAGTVTTLTCTEQNVPGGLWYYTVTPSISLWTGAESTRSTGISTDSTAPVATVSAVSPTPNAAGWNNTSPVTLTITADDGPTGSGVASITYAINGGTQQTVSGASVTVPVGGNGTHTVSYFATDTAGNSGSAQTQTVWIDAQAPAAPGLRVPAYVNSANVTAVPVTGTAEAGTKITLTANDAGAVHSAPAATATADGTGHWTASMDLSSLDQGTVTYSATATDAAGNVGAAGTATSTKDTNAPAATPGVNVPTYINAATVQTANTANASSVPVSGTAEVNATVMVKATDPGGRFVNGTAVASGPSGEWSLHLNLGSNSAMADGTITYTITVTDPAGNTGSPATPTPTSMRDTAAPMLSMDTLNSIYSVNVGTYKVTGTTDSSAPVRLTITDSTTNVTGSASGFIWAVSDLNLSSLKETSTSAPVSTVNVTAEVGDAAGNSTTVTRSVLKDTTGPTVTNVTGANGTGQGGNASTQGVLDKGDFITVQFSEPMDPAKFCPGWNGSEMAGTVSISDAGANDIISFTGSLNNTACTAAPAGQLLLGANYVGSQGATFEGNGTNASKLTLDSTGKLTMKVGSSKSGTVLAPPPGTPAYKPSSGLTDTVGNPLPAPFEYMGKTKTAF